MRSHGGATSSDSGMVERLLRPNPEGRLSPVPNVSRPDGEARVGGEETENRAAPELRHRGSRAKGPWGTAHHPGHDEGPGRGIEDFEDQGVVRGTRDHSDFCA